MLLAALLLAPATALAAPALRSSACSRHSRPALLLAARHAALVGREADRHPTLRQWATAESNAVAPMFALYALHATLKRTLDGLGLAFPASMSACCQALACFAPVRRRAEAWRHLGGHFSPWPAAHAPHSQARAPTAPELRPPYRCAVRAWRVEAADAIERFFAPACHLFRAWLAAIFAPGLARLA